MRPLYEELKAFLYDMEYSTAAATKRHLDQLIAQRDKLPLDGNANVRFNAWELDRTIRRVTNQYQAQLRTFDKQGLVDISIVYDFIRKSLSYHTEFFLKTSSPLSR